MKGPIGTRGAVVFVTTVTAVSFAVTSPAQQYALALGALTPELICGT